MECSSGSSNYYDQVLEAVVAGGGGGGALLLLLASAVIVTWRGGGAASPPAMSHGGTRTAPVGVSAVGTYLCLHMQHDPSCALHCTACTPHVEAYRCVGPRHAQLDAEQPCVLGAATPRVRGCSPMCQSEAAALRVRGCSARLDVEHGGAVDQVSTAEQQLVAAHAWVRRVAAWARGVAAAVRRWSRGAHRAVRRARGRAGRGGAACGTRRAPSPRRRAAGGAPWP